MKIAELYRATGAVPNVDIVLVPSRAACFDAIALELTGFNPDVVIGCVISGKDSLLIIVEIASAARQSVTTDANASAVIAIGCGDSCAVKFESFDVCIISGEHPNPFLLCDISIGVESCHPIRAANDEVIIIPDSDIANISAGIDEDGIAICDE